MFDGTDLRIGYVLKRFPRFSETFILNELLALQTRGVGLEIYSLLTPPDEPRHARFSDLKAPVTYLAKPPKSPLPATDARDAALFAGHDAAAVAGLVGRASEIARRAKAAGIRHLHAHFASDAATVALLAARVIGGTFSFTAHARDIYHTYVTPELDDAKRRAKLREAAFVVTVSDHNAAHLRALCPEAETRIHRLYNGIDLNAFAPAPLTDRIAGRIISVGRLVEKKGFHVLLSACEKLKTRGVAFDCRIIGDGPLHDTLANTIRAKGLQDAVRLAGPMPQEQLAQELGTASMATLPCIITADGDRDGLPTVLLEAMAKALPIVTTTVTGGPEIVASGVTGLLCEPDDADGLADALQALLADPVRAADMGAAGRKRAEALFDLRTNADRLVGHFRKAHDLALAGGAS